MSEFEKGWRIPDSAVDRPPYPLPPTVAAFVDGMKPDERRVWIPAERAQAGDNRFYSMHRDLDLPDGKYTWLNKPSPDQSFGGGGYGFAGLGTPVMRVETRNPLKPFDLWGGYLDRWIVSQRALDIFKEFDSAGIEYVEIDWAQTTGERQPQAIYWLDVTRGMHAYDVERSNLIFRGYAGYPPHIEGHGPALIRRDIDPSVHVYREGGRGGAVFVSAELRAAIEGAKLKKVRFEDIAAGTLFEE